MSPLTDMALVTLSLQHNEFHIANLAGEMWGDLIYRKDMEAEARLTPAEKKAKEAKMALQLIADKQESIKYSVDKHIKLYTGATGLSTKKFNTPCNKEHMEGGCWTHNERPGACSFVHSEEEAYYTPIFASFGVPHTLTPSRNALWVVGAKGNMAILSKARHGAKQ